VYVRLCRALSQPVVDFDVADSVHCIKRYAIFPSPAGISQSKLSLAGNNLGKTLTYFYSVFFSPSVSIWHPSVNFVLIFEQGPLYQILGSQTVNLRPQWRKILSLENMTLRDISDPWTACLTVITAYTHKSANFAV
jgi:hypothetical protein